MITHLASYRVYTELYITTPVAVRLDKQPGSSTTLAQHLSLKILAQFCRCSIAADRLLSLGDFAMRDLKRPRREYVAGERNLVTMGRLVVGSLHAALTAVDALHRLGVAGLVSGDGAVAWKRLTALRAEWNAEPP